MKQWALLLLLLLGGYGAWVLLPGAWKRGLQNRLGRHGPRIALLVLIMIGLLLLAWFRPSLKLL